jgi:hypothetical protein
MKHALFNVSVTALLALMLIGATPAVAQSRVFVAAAGNDANSCTLAQPCRTLQRAHDVVALGGEIDVLDVGGYGTLTITKSVSIQGHGFASITQTADGAAAITIDASPSLSQIHLQGLLLDGAGAGPIGSGPNGIAVGNAASVIIRYCVVRSFNGNGIMANTSTQLRITDTVIADNVTGLAIAPLQTSTVSLNHVDFQDNVEAILASSVNMLATGSVFVTVANSTLAGNVTGIGAFSSGQITNVLVTRSSIVDGGTGLSAQGGFAFIRLNESTISHNGAGWIVGNGGSVTSWHNNAFDDNNNTGDTVPPPSPSPLQ